MVKGESDQLREVAQSSPASKFQPRPWLAWARLSTRAEWAWGEEGADADPHGAKASVHRRFASHCMKGLHAAPAPAPAPAP